MADINDYLAKDLLGRMRDRGPLMKMVPLAVVETIGEAATEIERLHARVAELETPTYYWDDRDLDSAVDPEDVVAYDDAGDILPFRPIHELPVRWALVTQNGPEWLDSQEAAEARQDELVLEACRRGNQQCHICPDTGCCDNLTKAEKAGGDDDAQ